MKMAAAGASVHGASLMAATFAASCNITPQLTDGSGKPSPAYDWVAQAKQDVKDPKAVGDEVVKEVVKEIASGDPEAEQEVATLVGREPRFISEAYVMKFPFEPGNYYLAGRDHPVRSFVWRQMRAGPKRGTRVASPRPWRLLLAESAGEHPAFRVLPVQRAEEEELAGAISLQREQPNKRAASRSRSDGVSADEFPQRASRVRDHIPAEARHACDIIDSHRELVGLG